ncbi:MAG: IclR family transcriptional regulator, acetate operon repressor [Solirubrobacteraceae bacterium]
MAAPEPGAPRRRGAEPVRAYPVMHTVRALERLAFQPLSAPELALALQIHQRTARRLLARLAAEDHVTATPGHRRRYHLTMRLAALGRQAVAHTRWLHSAAPWVATLAAQTGQPAGLWVPCYTDVVCVLAAHPGGPPPQPQLGELAPAHASAPGRALLAHRTAWRHSLLAQPLERHTERTLTDPRELAADLDQTRHRGYATDHGEHDPQLHALAAPVLLADDPIAALSTTLNADDTIAADLDSLAANVTSIATALSSALNDTTR